MTETIIINGRQFTVVSSTPIKAPVKRKAHRQSATPLDGEPKASGTLTLRDVPPSANSLFHNRSKGRGKTLSYRNWRAFADRELRDQPSWHVPGKVEIRIYLAATTRGDADNRIKATLDALVCAGRIEDDRNVVKVSAEFTELHQVGAVIHIQGGSNHQRGRKTRWQARGAGTTALPAGPGSSPCRSKILYALRK